MEYTNHWRSVQGDVLGSRVAEKAEQAGASYLHLTSEDGHPYIEVAFENIIHPYKAIEIGKLIEEVFGAPVYLFGIRPHSINFYVAYDKLVWEDASINESYLEDCATRLEEVAAVWKQA